MGKQGDESIKVVETGAVEFDMEVLIRLFFLSLNTFDFYTVVDVIDNEQGGKKAQ